MFIFINFFQLILEDKQCNNVFCFRNFRNFGWSYLACRTSLEKLYSYYSVLSLKETYPYQWFNSLDKLKTIMLPPKEAFISVLTIKSNMDEMYKRCIDVWNSMPTSCRNVKTFGNYIRYYNDRYVLGLVEAVQKMICIENENKPDIFKESSLSGLTQRYLFKNLDNDYFTGFGREHKHLY